MHQPVVVYIGLRYIRGRTSDRFSYFISWLSAIGITLGVMALVIVLSLMNGFERELENKILGLMPQALITTSDGRLDPKRIPSSMIDTLQGVTRITPLITNDLLLLSAKNVAVGVMLGVNPTDYEPLASYLLNTRIDQLTAGQYKVILGDYLAKRLAVKPGDQLRLMVPDASQFTPMGRMPSQRLFTVIGIYAANSEVDHYQVLVNQKDASRLMHYPIGYVTGWRLWLQQPLAVDTLSQQNLPEGLVWKDWRERKGELFQAVRMEKNMLGLLLSLIVLVATFNIITSLGLLVMEKQAEVAILQTIGLTRHQVMLVFMVQGASAGVLGTLFGTCFGALLASQLNRLMPALNTLLNSASLPVDIQPLQVTTIALLAMMITLVSTLYPSYRATSVHPAKVLRYE